MHKNRITNTESYLYSCLYCLGSGMSRCLVDLESGELTSSGSVYLAPDVQCLRGHSVPASMSSDTSQTTKLTSSGSVYLAPDVQCLRGHSVPASMSSDTSQTSRYMTSLYNSTTQQSWRAAILRLCAPGPRLPASMSSDTSQTSSYMTSLYNSTTQQSWRAAILRLCVPGSRRPVSQGPLSTRQHVHDKPLQFNNTTILESSHPQTLCTWPQMSSVSGATQYPPASFTIQQHNNPGEQPSSDSVYLAPDVQCLRGHSVPASMSSDTSQTTSYMTSLYNSTTQQSWRAAILRLCVPGSRCPVSQGPLRTRQHPSSDSVYLAPDVQCLRGHSVPASMSSDTSQTTSYMTSLYNSTTQQSWRAAILRLCVPGSRCPVSQGPLRTRQHVL
ncbi:hypothetical protein J6590_106664 [Homalodisca vitripennis]|nr:hypothetical protein J6590_106664 [Homalodisca vitripennis]